MRQTVITKALFLAVLCLCQFFSSYNAQEFTTTLLLEEGLPCSTNNNPPCQKPFYCDKATRLCQRAEFVGQNQACDNEKFQCKSGYACVFDTNGPQSGTCKSLVSHIVLEEVGLTQTVVCNDQYNTYANRTVNSPCNSRDFPKNLCQRGTSCHASLYQCTPIGYAPPGMQCSGLEIMECNGDADCINGKCVASVGAGDSCTEAASVCRKGTVCSLSKCILMGSLKRGDQCSATPACGAGLYCKFGSDAFPTCEPRLADGSSCSFDRECSIQSYCDSSTMKCTARKAVGQSCTLSVPSQYAAYSGQSSMCSTLLCDSGVCTNLQSKTQGQSCTTELACAQGLACVSRVCTPRKLGDLCQPSTPSACPLGSACICDGSAFRCRINATSCQSEYIDYLMALSDKHMFGDPGPYVRAALCCNAKYSPDLYHESYWRLKCKDLPPNPANSTQIWSLTCILLATVLFAILCA